MMRYLEAATAWPGVAQALQESDIAPRQFIGALLNEESGGLWIYLHFVIHEIERRKHELQQLDGLPDGLTQFYTDYWTGQRATDMGRWYQLYLPLLATLAAAAEAIPVENLVGMGPYSVHIDA